jgi:hypothetical protein
MVSHTLRIKSMHWKNLRNYEQIPNQRLGDSKMVLNSKPHSLLQIQNNYGKTTTMHLLRSLFTGMKLKPEHLPGYGYRQNTKEWGGLKGQPGSFKVFFELDDELFAIETTIDPLHRKQHFFTYRGMSEDRTSGGLREGWQPPAYFVHLFHGKPDFVDLFILDGEKAKELNSSAGKKDKIGVAIRQVTGLMGVCDLIDEGNRKGRISDLVVNVLSKDIGKRGTKTTGLENNLEECLKWKASLQSKAEEINTALSALKNDLAILNLNLEKFDNEKMEGSKLLQLAIDDERKAKQRLKDATAEIMKDLFNPANIFSESIWEDVKAFYDSQIQGKMPKGMTKNWFNEIVENHPHCICGTEWNETMLQFITEHKEDYLDDLLMPRVKFIQQEVVNSQNKATIVELKRKLDAHRMARLETRRTVRGLRDDFPEDEKKQYESYIKQKIELENHIIALQYDYDVITSTNRDFIIKEDLNRNTLTAQGTPHIMPSRFGEIPNIFELEKVESYLRNKLLEASDSATQARGASILQEVLALSIERLLKEINGELEVKMNAVAQKMPGLNVDIKITAEGLQFMSPTGDVQQGLNESGQLGAIYGLVASLNQYSDISLPIIVDTPLAGFGRGMAKAWKGVVPGSFGQTIALINSSEKFDLKFWWESQPEDIQFYTFLRENENHLTGVDHGWTEGDEQQTTGTMYVESSFDIFSEYESDVGYDQKGGA